MEGRSGFRLAFPIQKLMLSVLTSAYMEQVTHLGFYAQ
jgi:hypothetical protein